MEALDKKVNEKIPADILNEGKWNDVSEFITLMEAPLKCSLRESEEVT